MCPLPDQWEAMYIFDVLIYNEGRTEQRMLYDTRRWGLVLVGYDRAFSNKKGPPRHLVDASLDFTDGWQRALEALSDDVLFESLGDVLDKRRMTAIAARRDEILAAKRMAEQN